jgi:GNAT superfamily N-acetyltransferase
VFSGRVPAHRSGVELVTAATRATVGNHSGNGDVAALAVRMICENAIERLASADGPTEFNLDIVLDGTEIVVTVDDRGEPVTGPPPAVLALVDLGLITSAVSRNTGSGNTNELRIPLPAHSRTLDDGDVERLPTDIELSDEPVDIRPLEAGDAAALTRCLYRCYGWTYPAPEFYFPERIAADLENGRRIGEVAVTADGEVAAHWGAVEVADGVVETGGTITDPRFRRRGIANVLGERLLARLVESGVRGRMREPVLTHPATQHIALREGAHIVGIQLDATEPLKQVGITDGLLDQRVSLTLMFSPLVPLEPATMWIPSLYSPIVEMVLRPTGWPRTIGVAGRTPDCPASTVITSAYDALNHLGSVTVEVVGEDLVDVVDEALHQLQRAGAEVVFVKLPANQEALATKGAGLGALGLGFASVIPRFGTLGDALTLQWLRDPDIDASGWQFADERVEALARAILSQAREVGDDTVRLRRRAARRAELFAALPTTP